MTAFGVGVEAEGGDDGEGLGGRCHGRSFALP